MCLTSHFLRFYVKVSMFLREIVAITNTLVPLNCEWLHVILSIQKTQIVIFITNGLVNSLAMCNYCDNSMQSFVLNLLNTTSNKKPFSGNSSKLLENLFWHSQLFNYTLECNLSQTS